MKKLKLNLVIRVPDGPEISTALRVFDLKSHKAAEYMIKSGSLGSYRKSSFFLSGFYQTDSGEWDVIDFPFFRMTTGLSSRNVRVVPEELVDILN